MSDCSIVYRRFWQCTFEQHQMPIEGLIDATRHTGQSRYSIAHILTVFGLFLFTAHLCICL